MGVLPGTMVTAAGDGLAEALAEELAGAAEALAGGAEGLAAALAEGADDGLLAAAGLLTAALGLAADELGGAGLTGAAAPPHAARAPASRTIAGNLFLNMAEFFWLAVKRSLNGGQIFVNTQPTSETS